MKVQKEFEAFLKGYGLSTGRKFEQDCELNPFDRLSRKLKESKNDYIWMIELFVCKWINISWCILFSTPPLPIFHLTMLSNFTIRHLTLIFQVFFVSFVTIFTLFVIRSWEWEIFWYIFLRIVLSCLSFLVLSFWVITMTQLQRFFCIRFLVSLLFCGRWWGWYYWGSLRWRWWQR